MARGEDAYREALAWYRDFGVAELLAEGDALRAALAEAEAGWPDPATAAVALPLARARLRAARDEWRRRAALYLAGRDVPDPRDERYAAWRGLAQEVRERADIAGVFAAAGWPLERQGRELKGPCPACGGDDRCVVWPEERRFWCRQCGLWGDPITAWRTLVEPGFHAAVRSLAVLNGLPLPDERAALGGMERERAAGRVAVPTRSPLRIVRGAA